LNRGVRSVIRTAIGSALLPVLLGLAGCSDQGTITESKEAVVKKRDDIQKATQSGIPGKTNVGTGDRAR
jgi:hypothetical protein